MRACEPVAVDGTVVVLGFEHEFHRDKVEEEKNKRDVEDVLSNLAGQRCSVRCVLSSPEETAQLPQSFQHPASESAGGEGSSSAEHILAEDPVVRAAVEDLGAQIVQ